MEDIKQLEEKIGYHFNDISILRIAVTHSSYVKEHDKCSRSNERLEFLGDAFFDAIIGEELFRMFPRKEEGFLSRTRATLVCEKSLAGEAKKIELGNISCSETARNATAEEAECQYSQIRWRP